MNFYKSKLVKSLKYQSILSSNKTDLSSYLDGMTCIGDTPKTNFNLFNISNPFFIKDNYIYNPYHLTSKILDKEDFDILMNNTKDIYDISYLLSKNKLRVLTIYLLNSDAEEYYDNVLNRENDSLLAFENTISECFFDEITICYSIDEIQNFEKQSIHTFHENHIPTNQKDFLEKLKKLFRKQNIDADSFLIDFSEKKIFKTDSFYSLIKNNFQKYNSLLGIKNIRIPSFSLTLPVELNNAKTNNWIINITKDDIFPNIVRDSINDKVSSDISEAIGYAFSMYLYDKETDNYKKDFLLSFIRTAYSSKNNSFMKLNY